MQDEEQLSEVQKLIRLKRYECPPEGTVDEFLVEFQRRQRSQALTGSSTKLFFERLSTYMSSFGTQKWVFGAGAAYACVMLFFLVRPSDTEIGTTPKGGGAVPVDAKGSRVIEEPDYDPKKNRARPLPAPVPDVIVF